MHCKKPYLQLVQPLNPRCELQSVHVTGKWWLPFLQNVNNAALSEPGSHFESYILVTFSTNLYSPILQSLLGRTKGQGINHIEVNRTLVALIQASNHLAL